jgi:hypothetical protein
MLETFFKNKLVILFLTLAYIHLYSRGSFRSSTKCDLHTSFKELYDGIYYLSKIFLFFF